MDTLVTKGMQLESTEQQIVQQLRKATKIVNIFSCAKHELFHIFFLLQLLIFPGEMTGFNILSFTMVLTQVSVEGMRIQHVSV